MKLKDLKKLLESATDDTEIKVENGELVITEPKPIQYKFNIGDKVTFKDGKESYTVTDRFVAGKDCPAYKLDDCENVEEDKIELYVPKDITDRIKTFDDAYDWCDENGETALTYDYDVITCMDEDDAPGLSSDVLAYIKLRIITAALNEGWKPTLGVKEERWHIEYNTEQDFCVYAEYQHFTPNPSSLIYKSEVLANYACEQFADIYADFLGREKGGEE